MSFKGCNSCSFYFALIIKGKADRQQRGLGVGGVQFNLFADSLELKSVQLTPPWGGNDFAGSAFLWPPSRCRSCVWGTETDLDTCLPMQKKPPKTPTTQKTTKNKTQPG